MEKSFPNRNLPYWLETPLIKGQQKQLQKNGILIIGSGLSGTSCAYWLNELGYHDVTLVDYIPEEAASFRNCGHILYGAVESYDALIGLHGEETAKSIQNFSVEICEQVRKSCEKLQNLNIDTEYKQNGYYVLSISETEQMEIESSANKLNSIGIKNEVLSKKETENLGFKNCYGARFENGSAKAHPVKFRNGLINLVKENPSFRYHSGIKINSITSLSDGVEAHYEINGTQHKCSFDAAVICANAYSPLFSDFFSSRKLVEPFKGQIITSKPLKNEFKVKCAHSFDHGYEYGLVTEDNRLMIGGWRNNTPTGEIGSYDLKLNNSVEMGLADFVHKHYDIEEKIEWDHSWSGIMATSKTGFPFIGPTSQPTIYTCSGFTGHGFSWAHGSAKLLADIILGNKTPDVARHFNPINT